MFNIGDMVGRKSYEFDIIFEIVEINNNIATLIGKTIRLAADAPIDDLELMDDEVLLREEQKEEEVIDNITNQTVKKNHKRFLTGKILHIDGDEKYMRKCLDLYQKVGIYAVGIEVKEKEMPID